MASLNYMFPTSIKEVKALDWDYIDIILFSGDAFVDHPAFGTAVIARVLQKEGYRVAIVPQPNWRDDLRDFKKLGVPRLFFGVNSGAMDSMVNHYTAAKRLRSDDAYTPEGKASYRPDYAVMVYSNILKELYPDTLVIIGGIEASLRRFTHYDYWSDTLMPSILISSKADYITYGMGERSTIELASKIDSGATREELCEIPQIAYLKPAFISTSSVRGNNEDNIIRLHSYGRQLKNQKSFIENFNIIESEANKLSPKTLVERYDDIELWVNPPYNPASIDEMDSYYDLPYTKEPHPRYKGKTIPAFEMIKNSITIHRGCFGGCSFCTIAAHQGRFIQSRSSASILREIKKLTEKGWFRGMISDIGAPTANMYMMGGKDMKICSTCSRKSCLYPSKCANLNNSHDSLLKLYKNINALKEVNRSFIGSGIRYDLFLNEKGFYDESSKRYFEEIVLKHTSGRLKVAPEHTEDHVLELMYKPSFKQFERLKEEFEKIIRKANKNMQIVPYFISSHPGCTIKDMHALRANPALNGVYMEQVQDFTPTPMTKSSVMFYAERDTKTLKDIYVEKSIKNKRAQKDIFFKK